MKTYPVPNQTQDNEDMAALDGGQWSASCPSHFTPVKRAPGTYQIGCWVDPRADLDAVAKRENHCPC